MAGVCCFLLSGGKLSLVLCSSPGLAASPLSWPLSISGAFRTKLWDKAPKSVCVSSGVVPALLGLGMCRAAHVQAVLHSHFCLLEELGSVILVGPFQLRAFCGSALGSLICSRAQGNFLIHSSWIPFILSRPSLIKPALNISLALWRRDRVVGVLSPPE